MKLPDPPRTMTVERRTLDAKQWRAAAIDPRAFGGMYDGGYRETCVESGVAFVYVCGPLDHHQSWWLDSYDSIVCRVEYALADVDAQAVVICFDTPGGDASGVEEAHRKIKALRAQYAKPVYAYANESCYSAGYWLAAACDGIWLPTTGGVGSVGVIAEVVDLTAMDEKNGVRIELVTTGKQKADGHPDRPLTDEILARVQDRVNKIGEVFFASVAEARGMKPEAVQELQAACLLGADAKAAGLADDVISWDAFIEDVRAGFDTGKNRAKTTGAIMTPSEKTLSEAITAARAALAAAITDEDLAACTAKLTAAIDAKVKYSKRVRTDEETVDDGNDEEDPEDDKPEDDAEKSEEDDEDAGKAPESEEARAGALAAFAKGGELVASVYDAAAALTGKSDLSEIVGALAGLKPRLAAAVKLEERVAALESDKRAARVDAMIKAASVEGKIAAGSPQAKNLAEQGLKDPKWLKGYLATLPKIPTVTSGGAVPRENPASAELSIESMSADERKIYENAAASAGVSLEKFMEAARATAGKMAASARPTH
jgi:capsid assembly protease